MDIHLSDDELCSLLSTLKYKVGVRSACDPGVPEGLRVLRAENAGGLQNTGIPAHCGRDEMECLFTNRL